MQKSKKCYYAKDTQHPKEEYNSKKEALRSKKSKDKKWKKSPRPESKAKSKKKRRYSDESRIWGKDFKRSMSGSSRDDEKKKTKDKKKDKYRN